MTYIAYKGFTPTLGTNYANIQYQIGGTYSKENPVKNPVLCTDQGYHYCDRLIDTFRYYGFPGARFCEIEVLGNYTKGGFKDQWKNTTTSFKILRELHQEELLKIKEREEKEKTKWEFRQKQQEIPKNLKLNIVKEIQEHYPMAHIGGSAGLFLHGVRLQRWANTESSDLDMIFPYFVLLESSVPKKEENGKLTEKNTIDVEEIKKSGNDFDNAIVWYSELGSAKVDIKIDPKQAYEIVEYDGFRYKVSKLETIMEAKVRYALLPMGQKHREDIREMVKYNKFGEEEIVKKEEKFDFLG